MESALAIMSLPSSSVQVGDFNGDGNLDLVVANNNAGDVSVLLGDGSGNFATALNSSTGLATSGFGLGSVAVGDFNADGILDVAVVNGQKVDGAVAVLLGNGNGTFTAVASYAISGTLPTPVSVAVGDFNGDGKVDLVVASSNGSTVSILLGNGDGSFELPVNYSAGWTPDGVVVADVNKDGKLDLVTVDQNIDGVTVPVQVVDATLAWSLSAGVSKPKVFLGR